MALEEFMYLSVVAIVISALSLFVSTWALLRDRSRLKVYSIFYPGHEDYGQTGIKFKAVNRGRRPIYIRSIGGDIEENGWHAQRVGEDEFGKKLEENQYVEEHWNRNDLIVEAPNFTDRYVSIWFEDSLGRRYKVPGSKRYIKQLMSSKK